jgi:hypothetical protein
MLIVNQRHLESGVRDFTTTTSGRIGAVGNGRQRPRAILCRSQVVLSPGECAGGLLSDYHQLPMAA